MLIETNLGTQSWNRIIANGGRLSGKSEIGEILEACRAEKPSQYDEEQQDIALMYAHRQHELTAKAMEKRYPESFRHRPVYTVNTVRHSARLNAQAYAMAPARYQEVEVDGQWMRPGWKPTVKPGEAEVPEVMPEEAWRQEQMRTIERAARLHVLMPEWERRTEASTDHFCRIVPRDGVLEGVLFWPHSFGAIPNREAPGRVNRASLICARLGVRGKSPTYEVWVRTIADDGAVSYEITHITESGDVTLHKTWAYDECPWFSMHAVDPQGTMFHQPNHDQVVVNVDHNLLLSSFLYREDYQGAKQVFITGGGDELDEAKLKGGPGRIINLKKKDAQVTVVDAVTDMVPIDAAEMLLRMQGNAGQQNPDSWATDPGNPPSGVSRDIRNIQSDRKREDNVALHTLFEEDDFLPRLARLAVGGGVAERRLLTYEGGRVRYRCAFPPPRRYEEPEARRLRLSNGMRDGVITPAQYATGAFPELFPTLEEAIAFGVPHKLLPMAPEAPTSRAMIPGSEPPPVQQEGVAVVDELAVEERMAPSEAPPTLDVQKTALNGAQVQSMAQTVREVAEGKLPRESGINILVVGFQIGREEAERVMGPAGTSAFTPAVDEPARTSE